DRRAVGLVLQIAAVERGAKFRYPVVLDGGVNVPGRRELKTGLDPASCVVGKISIVNPGKPDTVTPPSGPEQVGDPGAGIVDTAFAVADAILALHGKGVALGKAEGLQIQFETAADGEAPPVVGMSEGVDDTVNGRRHGPAVEVSARAIVMQDGGDLRPAPGLIGPEAGDDVGDHETGIGETTVGGSAATDLEGVVSGEGLDDGGAGAHGGGVADIKNRMSEVRGVLQRDVCREAAAELCRVAVSKDADAGIVLVEEVSLVAVFRRIEEVVERRRLAESEATPLNEGAQQIGVAVGRVRRACGATGASNSGAREAQRW